MDDRQAYRNVVTFGCVNMVVDVRSRLFTGKGDFIVMTTNGNNVLSATESLWTETKMITLNKCEVYSCALHRMIQQLKSDGSTDVDLPQFLKSELSQILNGGIVRENKQILRGTDLDEYLRKHLVCLLYTSPSPRD